MEWLVTWLGLEALAHQVTVEEDGGGTKRRLRQLEHHAHLENKVDALAPQCSLLLCWHAIQY
jgi:hypothetical protein